MVQARSPQPFKVPAALSDAEWEIIEPLLAPSGKGGRPAIDQRRSIEGMRWVALTGKPWCDLPTSYGNAAAVRRYYARLKKRGTIEKLLRAFPKWTSKDDQAKATARAQLACLQSLMERRARGRAANQISD